MFARTGRRTAVAALVAAAGALATLALLGACAATLPPPTPSATPTPTTTPTGTGVVATASLEAVIDAPREHPTLTVVGAAEPLAGETAQQVTYPSGGITVAGVLRTPAGLSGPAPIAIVVHGAVDPSKYQSGRDRTSEQRALLAAGYVVLAVDLRGFGASDPADVAGSVSVDPGFGWPIVLDWGMALDVANALRLGADGRIPGGDPARVVIVGHSLGGLLAIDGALIEPGIPRIVIALNPAPIDLSFALESSGMSADQMPSLSPSDLAALQAGSAVPFVARAKAPLLVVQGSADDVIRPEWSQHTVDVWQGSGATAQLVVVDGADHGLQPHLQQVADLVVGAANSAIG